MIGGHKGDRMADVLDDMKNKSTYEVNDAVYVGYQRYAPGKQHEQEQIVVQRIHKLIDEAYAAGQKSMK